MYGLKRLNCMLGMSSSAKANLVLEIFKSVLTSRVFSLWKRLYTTYVLRDHKFENQARDPHLVGDINILEKVQPRETRIPHVLKGHKYKTRCIFVDSTGHNFFKLSVYKS